MTHHIGKAVSESYRCGFFIFFLVFSVRMCYGVNFLEVFWRFFEWRMADTTHILFILQKVFHSGADRDGWVWVLWVGRGVGDDA